MHDVIRDLALWIFNGCKSNSSSSSKTTGKFLMVASNNVSETWRNAERIFWTNDSINNRWEEPPRFPDLLTLIVQQRRHLDLPQSFFQLTPFLRVLDLSNTRLSELPTSIGELSDLQYLGLSNTWIKELPVELRKLVKLKFLDLSHTYNLSKIPAGVIANLSKLQVLKLNDSGFEDWELKEEDGNSDWESSEDEEDGGGLSFGELDRLKQLQELGITINTSLALEKLLYNQKLRMVCTDLCCTDIIQSISLAPPSSISEGGVGLMNLKRLEYSFMRSSSVELEELTLFIIIGAAGGLLKNININNNVYHHHHAFQNLDTIRISCCDKLKDLTWVVYVENLKTLGVSSCDELETIIEYGGLEGTAGRGGGGGGGEGVFGRLENLDMLALTKLKSICRHALAFPSIRTIWITGCPELKKLPLDSASNVNNTLKGIYGRTEWWNELQWEDETIKSKFIPYFL